MSRNVRCHLREESPRSIEDLKNSNLTCNDMIYDGECWKTMKCEQNQLNRTAIKMLSNSQKDNLTIWENAHIKTINTFFTKNFFLMFGYNH